MAGERLMVMPVNENRVLCELQTNRKTNCDEMATARQEIDDIYQLQNYVDAQAGGPGKGFFQIVTDPFEARRVINEGKMAVVLEIEVSEPFGCRGWRATRAAARRRSTPSSRTSTTAAFAPRCCSTSSTTRSPASGSTADRLGLLINGGNKISSGSFLSAETCKGPEHDNEIFTGAPTGFLATLLTTLGIPGGTLPAYPPAPHCNTRGLTSLGAHTVEQMMDHGMIVNPDHMSQRGGRRDHQARRAAPLLRRDLAPRLDGSPQLAPDLGARRDGVPERRIGVRLRPGLAKRSGRRSTPYYFGWGWGADLGGLATQGAPVPPGSPARVTYPFKSLDGAVTVDRQRTGQRVFDYANEGVAHYGLYADWTDEVRKLGGPTDRR